MSDGIRDYGGDVSGYSFGPEPLSPSPEIRAEGECMSGKKAESLIKSQLIYLEALRKDNNLSKYGEGQMAAYRRIREAITEAKQGAGEMCEDCDDAICRKTAPGPCDCSCHKPASERLCACACHDLGEPWCDACYESNHVTAAPEIRYQLRNWHHVTCAGFGGQACTCLEQREALIAELAAEEKR